MVKLNEKKIRWIIREKLRGREAGEMALIQRVSHSRVEQIWEAYKQTRVIPALRTPGRHKKTSTSLRDITLTLEAYDRLKVNALTLEKVLKRDHGLNLTP